MTLRPLAIALLLVLAACSSVTPLPTGLSARMDQPGASLDRAAALGMMNQYRAATGAQALTGDASLDAAAQALAAQYLQTSNPPRQPAGTILRTSAGYTNFAETFSGWRATPADASALADKTMRRAGLAVVYGASSAYGVYWVLLLAP